MSSQNGLQKLIDSLHPLYQEDALFFNDVRNYWNSKKESKIFWYLSSGLDLFPLGPGFLSEKELPKPDLFIFTDKAPIASSLKKSLQNKKLPLRLPGEKIILKKFIPLKSSMFDAPLYYLEFFNKVESCLPLLLFECENTEVLRLFKKLELSVDYLCTVADGCQTERSQFSAECPMLSYLEYSEVLGDGYWLSDHLPKQNEKHFKRIDRIEGWGRYNIFDQTGIYKINTDEAEYFLKE